jgi:hypothetical protein
LLSPVSRDKFVTFVGPQGVAFLLRHGDTSSLIVELIKVDRVAFPTGQPGGKKIARPKGASPGYRNRRLRGAPRGTPCMSDSDQLPATGHDHARTPIGATAAAPHKLQPELWSRNSPPCLALVWVAHWGASPRLGSDSSLQRWPIVLTKPFRSDRVEDKAG